MRRCSETTPLLIALIVLASMAAPAGATIVPIADQVSWDTSDHAPGSVAFLDLTPSEIYLQFGEETSQAEVNPDECFTPVDPDAAAGAPAAGGAPGDSTSQELPGAATTLLGASGGALLLMARCLRRGRNWAIERAASSSHRRKPRTVKAPAVRRCWYRESRLLYATCVSSRDRQRD